MMFKDKIIDEIKEMAPRLAAIKRINCYQVPDQYFENIVLKQELLKTQHYKIPDDYFNALQSEVLSQISNTRETKKKPSIYRKMLPWTMGIAASLLLLISIPLLTENNEPEYSIEEENNDLEYLSENIDEFDLDELLDLSETEAGSIDFLETKIIEDYIENNLGEFDLDELESLL